MKGAWVVRLPDSGLWSTVFIRHVVRYKFPPRGVMSFSIDSAHRYRSAKNAQKAATAFEGAVERIE